MADSNRCVALAVLALCLLPARMAAAEPERAIWSWEQASYAMVRDRVAGVPTVASKIPKMFFKPFIT